MVATHCPSARSKILPSLRPRRLRAMLLLLFLCLSQPAFDRCHVRTNLLRDLPRLLALGLQLDRPRLSDPVELVPASRRATHPVCLVHARRQLEPPLAKGALSELQTLGDRPRQLQAQSLPECHLRRERVHEEILVVNVPL